jgi:putative transposase
VIAISYRDRVQGHLGYYYRRKRMQEKYDRLYGAISREKRKIMKKLKEEKKRKDLRWKLANIIVEQPRKNSWEFLWKI